jgi:hypothetical protein
MISWMKRRIARSRARCAQAPHDQKQETEHKETKPQQKQPDAKTPRVNRHAKPSK